MEDLPRLPTSGHAGKKEQIWWGEEKRVLGSGLSSQEQYKMSRILKAEHRCNTRKSSPLK